MRTVSIQLFSGFYFSEQPLLNTGCSAVLLVFFHFYLLHFTIWLYFNRSLCIFIRILITVLKLLYSKIPLFKIIFLAMMEKHIVLQAALHDSFPVTDGAGSRRAGDAGRTGRRWRCGGAPAPAGPFTPAGQERAPPPAPPRCRRGSHGPRPRSSAAGK